MVREDDYLILMTVSLAARYQMVILTFFKGKALKQYLETPVREGRGEVQHPEDGS